MSEYGEHVYCSQWICVCEYLYVWMCESMGESMGENALLGTPPPPPVEIVLDDDSICAVTRLSPADLGRGMLMIIHDLKA